MAYMPSYFHDAKTGVCEPFVYGGCGGNANRFSTLAECQAACGGGSPDLDACSGPGDCALASAGCCGACDPVDAQAFVAVGRGFLAQYLTIHGCDGVACGPCPPVTELELTQQYFVATCVSNHCTVVDIRQTKITECAEAIDCYLRDGAQCCQGCDGVALVSVNRNGGLEALVCGSNVACPGCVPPMPTGYAPYCEAGRCKIGAIK